LSGFLRIKTDFLVALRPLLFDLYGLKPPPAGGYAWHTHEMMQWIEVEFCLLLKDRLDLRPAEGGPNPF